MNFKILLPWLCAIGLGAGFAVTFISNQTKESELTKLRQENAQFQQSRTDLEEAQNQAKVLETQVADFKKEREELLRLRGEVNQLRAEKQQLSKQVQLAQSEAQRAQGQVAQASQAATQQLQQLQSENQQLRGVAVQGQRLSQRDACINNLRQIDAAKQQWALEHNKPADAIPTENDIAPYLKDKLLPACPAGGAYTLNSLSALPTCSIPGHALQ